MIKSGEIYYCDLSNSKGNLQKGKRPCIIVDNNMALSFSPCIHCVPLTTQLKKDFILHYKLKKNNVNCLEEDSFALCEQYQLINKSQIIDYIGEISKKDLIMIVELCKKNFPFNYQFNIKGV